MVFQKNIEAYHYKKGCPKSRNAGNPETRNAGNQDPEILKPGMTFREGKRAK